ncbi:hypothetical protein NQ314_013659 [Rhamnusium bicolor]|uniref:SEFIR domain-containing protein n=1 Tax=Rhamnusium bicolor TaxID=1586634 RepID=A0AAV8X5I1_9CUCU|nr:hypothetical protein NQ314_013659 [Rhamnusium bicolor]
MKLLLLFVTMLFNYVYVYDLCSVPDNTCSERHHLNNCKVKSMNFDSRDCSQVTFAGNEKLKTNLGDISLQVQHDLAPQLFLNISFSDVIWKKAYIRLSDDNNKNQNVCKMYTVEKEARIPLNGDLYDACLWNTAKKLRAKTYLLEYKAENKQDSMYKKILFDMPNSNFYDGLPDAVEKILILFKPSSDKHNDVVNTLAKTVKHLTGIEVMLDPVNLSKIKPKNADKWCCDNLVLATHIIYITPPDIDDNNCELDCITYNFLKEETKKTVPEKDIIILNLPYSTKDIPPCSGELYTI